MLNKKFHLKKILLLSLAGVALMQSFCFAFVYQLSIPEKSAITRFTDDQLIDAYLNALVELEAAKTFHQTSGFRPQDYEKHKELLRYHFDLLRELQKRKIEVPKFGE